MMIQSIFNKYKKDILFLALITAAFFTIEILFGKYFINPIIDFGREAYYPELMLKGKLLYKDLFNLFGPFAYQMNAFLYGIFGVNLSVLEMVGSFCSIAILYCTYFISRFFLSENLSLFTTVFVLITCIFSPSVFNFIFPYSYSLLYAYMFFLTSVVFFLLARKTKEKRDLYLFISYFLIGASLASKYEFLPFALLLLFYSIFVFKQNILKIIANIVAITVVPTICISILFHQGVRIEDFINNFYYLKNYLSSDSLKYFYSHTVGTLFSSGLFYKIRTIDFSITLAFTILIGLTFYALMFSTNRIKYLPECIVIGLGLLFTYIIDPSQLYMFTPYIIYILFTYKIVKCFKNKTFDLINDYFLLILFVSIIAMSKTLFIIDTRIYGSFTLTIPTIAIIYFTTKILPEINDKLKKEYLEKLVLILLLLFSVATAQIYYNAFSEKSSPITTDKGTVYIYPEETKATRQLLKYIETHITGNKTLMIIPEGVFINFITNRELKLYNYSSLMPPYIDTYGIDNIIGTIKKAKIDYIIINERDLREYNGNDTICTDKYSDVQRTEESMLCNFIKDNYSLEETIGKSFTYEIYKLK